MITMLFALGYKAGYAGACHFILLIVAAMSSQAPARSVNARQLVDSAAEVFGFYLITSHPTIVSVAAE